MTDSVWFSCRVRLAVLVEGVGATRFNDSVCVFRAHDFGSAFEMAVAVGRSLETTYENRDGLEVRWRLVEVMTLDRLRAENADGAEVYSEPVELPAGVVIGFDEAFVPEESKPEQTGV